jgi:hypothetical protein
VLGRGDPAAQAMPRVGRDGPDLLFVGVESVGVTPDLLTPEPLLEARPEACRFPAQVGCPPGVSQRVEHLGHAHPGVEHVSLQLAERLRLLDLTAVRIHDRVARVLPADVLVSQGAPGSVLLEAVAVEVPVMVDPLEASERDVAVLAQEALVARPLPRLV